MTDVSRISIPHPLSRNEWEAQQQLHVSILEPYAKERVDRGLKNRKHPINDFLFEYYTLRPGQLLRWSPGVDVLLEEAKEKDLEWGRLFRREEDGLILRAEDFPAFRRDFLRWTLQYLESIRDRSPSFHCLGLHEWAMVYREANIRHQTTPLRLSPEEIAEVVESQDLRCTHYDAFRFFSEEAVPRNRFPLTRVTTDQFDQRGCVHVNMDLYKWCYKINPWCPGELLREAFLLAWDARQLDMRASPYDVREFDLEPIRIETREGQEEYIKLQRELSTRSIPLRERLIEVYWLLLFVRG